MASSGTLPPSGPQALVVEDETMIVLLIEDMLREMGCAAVRHATDVREALRLIDSARPDFAVLDVNLGGEQVYPVAERLDAARRAVRLRDRLWPSRHAGSR